VARRDPVAGEILRETGAALMKDRAALDWWKPLRPDPSYRVPELLSYDDTVYP
jgi:hypothetical protein